MPSPAFVELPIITTSLLEDIECLQESMAHQTAGEERLCLMPISTDSNSSKGEKVREASGRFICGRRSYMRGDGWILRRFLCAISSRYPHKHTHHKISDWMAIHTAVQFSTFMFIFGMFEY